MNILNRKRVHNCTVMVTFGRMFDHSLPACAFFFVCFWSGDYTYSTLYARTSPQWLSGLRRLCPNVSRQVACELVFGYVPTLCLDSGIVSPLRLRWVKGVSIFTCNLPPALHCGNTGVERTPNKCQHTKLTLEKKILPPLLLGFELTVFRSRVLSSYQQAIPAPKLCCGTKLPTLLKTSFFF